MSEELPVPDGLALIEHRAWVRALAILVAPLGVGTARTALEAHSGATMTSTAADMSEASGATVRAAGLAAVGVAGIAAAVWLLSGGFTALPAPEEEDGTVASPPGRGVEVARADDEPRKRPPRRAAPRDADEEKPAQEGAAPAQVSGAEATPWIAYDLADGKPLRGFSLRVKTADSESVVTTDEMGAVPADPAKVLEVEPSESETWHFAKPDTGLVGKEPSLWFWRERRISGTVRAADGATPPTPADVTFRVFAGFAEPIQDDPKPGFSWRAGHGFRPRPETARGLQLDASGRLTGSAPAIAGSLLFAEAPGFVARADRLAWNEKDDATVAIVFRPTHRIVGRVLDDKGDPVIDENVGVETVFDVASDADAEPLFAFSRRRGLIYSGSGDGVSVTGGGGGIAWGSARGSRGTLVLVETARTDVRGIFKLEALPDGTSTVRVTREGFAAARRDLGTPSDDVVGFEVRLVRSNASVAFVRSELPVASSNFNLQAADHRENGFFLRTDAAGRASACRLEPGRWYRVSNGADVVGCFLWKEQTTIDLANLRKSPPEEK